MSRTWKIEFKDTVPQFQSSGASRKRHKHDLNPQGTGISKTIRQVNKHRVVSSFFTLQ